MEDKENIQSSNEKVVEKTEIAEAKAEVKTVQTPKKNSKNNKKIKKESKVAKKIKETFNELKKVSWPSFSKVVKDTGIVLAVVAVFLVVVFGFDYVLNILFKLLTGSNA